MNPDHQLALSPDAMNKEIQEAAKQPLNAAPIQKDVGPPVQAAKPVGARLEGNGDVTLYSTRKPAGAKLANMIRNII